MRLVKLPATWSDVTSSSNDRCWAANWNGAFTPASTSDEAIRQPQLAPASTADTMSGLSGRGGRIDAAGTRWSAPSARTDRQARDNGEGSSVQPLANSSVVRGALRDGPRIPPQGFGRSTRNGRPHAKGRGRRGLKGSRRAVTASDRGRVLPCGFRRGRSRRPRRCRGVWRHGGRVPSGHPDGSCP